MSALYYSIFPRIRKAFGAEMAHSPAHSSMMAQSSGNHICVCASNCNCLYMSSIDTSVNCHAADRSMPVRYKRLWHLDCWHTVPPPTPSHVLSLKLRQPSVECAGSTCVVVSAWSHDNFYAFVLTQQQLEQANSKKCVVAASFLWVYCMCKCIDTSY